MEKQHYTIMGMRWQYFFIFFALYISAAFLNKLPSGLVGALGSIIVIAALTNEIGNRLPIVRSYLGGGAIVSILVGGLMVWGKWLPEATIKNIHTFMTSGGFLDFYIAALICGSILGMSRQFLIKAFIRYLPLILGGFIVAMIFVGIGGFLIGYGVQEAILYIGLPIMGGGTGAGAVPLSKIFGEAMNKDPKEIISVMLPAVSLGNAVAIVLAGLMNRIGKKFPSLSGNGKLLVGQTEGTQSEQEEVNIDMQGFGIGIVIACGFFVFGLILSKFIPIHNYALMIISVAVIKALDLLPEEYESLCSQWYQFVSSNFTNALLVGIGVAYLDIAAVLASISPQYITLVLLTVIGAVIGAGLMGKIFGFYPLEAALTGGLCMANMGGTGDVAVLSACKRMNLMPFAQVSSRIGGAFILLVATAILRALF
ncbi:MAG: 2-hydroxycarboxylate transporter family protein [Treponemataceae bacterium]